MTDTIAFYNTLTRSTTVLTPLDPPTVTMYHCGPTVYWTQHIGNLRAVVCADFIVRTMRFFDYDVQLVRNYTDVGHLSGDNDGDADQGEDRMEKAAKRESLNPDAIANKYISQYNQDIEALNTLEPTYRPRATECITDIIEMVQTLLDINVAYTTELAVYFDISKAKEYTRLSGQQLDENIAQAGTGTVTDPDKKHPADFALWFFKAGTHAHALQTWPSPFESPRVSDGIGFPGWHIECSAMAKKFLGPTIDIHMGGIEHIPVHHTNEIAQSEAANARPFAQIWLHNEHLMVDGGKMSKSQGTAFSLHEIQANGFNPIALRYFYLQAHYRSKQNFTWKALAAAQTALNKLYLSVMDWGEAATTVDPTYLQQFKQALADDCNTSQALAITWDMIKDQQLSGGTKIATIHMFDLVLGLNIETTVTALRVHLNSLPTTIQTILDQRANARLDNNWAQADALREQLEQHGYWVEDTPQGTKLIPKKI